ncbi:Protein TAR1 [Capsicum baccatum]|uniref:Protein TAR1 n=1 Tax=Capsicum baccatum TaxID=33114 RepID=A0A2G2UX21_CAPBA|nr:Protein TAR1 [Capsicum baccatum]
MSIDVDSHLGQPRARGAQEASIRPTMTMRPVIEARCEGATRCVTPRQTCPRPNGFGRNLRSKTRWFTGFCNSHQVSHFATFFIDARAEISVAESRLFLQKKHGSPRRTPRTGRGGPAVGSSIPWRFPRRGSPTETLLRLLLPLNDKVQWTSRDVAGSEPPTSPRSEHFTGSFNRQIAPPTKNGHAPPPIESRKSSQSVNPYYVWTWYAHTRTLLRRSRSVGGAPFGGIPPISFVVPYGFNRPLTHTHMRLLGPCFKTGRMGSPQASVRSVQMPKHAGGARCLPQLRRRHSTSISRARSLAAPTIHAGPRPGSIGVPACRRSTYDRGASPAPIRFPPDNVKHSLALFSKSFSSFSRGTCSLTVSRPYLGFDGIHRPIWAAFPNNPTRRQRLVV